jgi:signal peptidase II
MKKYLIIAVLLVVFDQLSKYLAYQYLSTSSVEITSFFSLTFAQNYGAAFSFFADGNGWQRYFLSGISIIASVILVVMIVRTPYNQHLRLSSLTLILSGALGNMIDRIFNGFVVDFIDVHYAGFYFPIFNLADVFIFVGVVFYFILDIKNE